jgi:hypothetical protein
MEVAVHLPDDIAKQLQDEWQDLPRSVLEGLALKGYCARVLTTEEVRRLLGFESRFDVHTFLAAHGVPFYTLTDLERDRDTSRKLGL